MGMPPDWFYTAIGNIGLYISPVIAALSAVLAKRKKGWIIASLPVIVCPLVFLLLFESAFLFSPYHGDLMHQSNFEGYTGETARYAFGFQVLGLLIFGSLIGFVSGYFIERLSSICEKQLV